MHTTSMRPARAATAAALLLMLVLSLLSFAPAQRAAAADPGVGHLMVHFIGEGKQGEQVYFSHSKDGLRWNDLNGGRPVLLNTIGTKGVRDPSIVRSPAGDRYWIIATDLCIGCGTSWGDSIDRGSPNLVVWESTDLVNWSAPRLLNVASGIPGARNAWAPEAIWDPTSNSYVLYWASNVPRDGRTKHRIFAARTTDFTTITTPQLYIDPVGTDEIIDTQIIEAPESPGGFRYYRSSVTGGQITVDASNSVLGSWTKLGNLAQAGFSNGGAPGTNNVEGPMWVRDNGSARWNLWLDQYATGRGYTPVATANLSDLASYRGRAQSEFALGATTKRHGFIMNLTAAEETRVLSRFNTAPVARIESTNFPGRYVRHAGFRARLDTNVSPSQDAQFRPRSGWTAGVDHVSFESVNYPGYYLRHAGFDLVLARNDGSEAFRLDSTFKQTPGLSDPSAASFQSVNFPDRYLRHADFGLRVDPVVGPGDRADATFRLVN